MVLPSRKRWVNTSLEFLVDLVKFVPRTLLSGYHQYRIHKIQKEQARSPMLEAVPTLESLGIVNTIPNEIGVGVYQGGILVLGRVETSQASPRWVVDTLRIGNLRNIQKDTLCHLLQAAGLISHYLQFCPLMQDSQNSNEIIRLQHCPYTNEPTHEKPVLLGGDNIAVCPAKELLLRLLGHNNQEYLAGQHPSTCPYSTATGSANQPKGHDTNEKGFNTPFSTPCIPHSWGNLRLGDTPKPPAEGESLCTHPIAGNLTKASIRDGGYLSNHYQLALPQSRGSLRFGGHPKINSKSQFLSPKQISNLDFRTVVEASSLRTPS